LSEKLATNNTSLAWAGSVLEDKFITLPDGLRVRYLEAGPADAPALLLAHGFLGSVYDWRCNISALADLAGFKSRRVIAFDWVGFGRSDKPDTAYSLHYFASFLKDFAEALHLKQFDLAGHSMGGKHCLAFAIYYPQYVRKLVLVDSDGFLADPWWTHQTNKWYFKPLANYSTVLLGKASFLKRFLKNVYYDPKLYPTEELIEQGALDLRQPDYMAALRALNRHYPGLSMRLTGLFERLPEIKIPIQIFWGLQDRILSISQGHTAQEYLPTASLYVFEHCGHLPQVEKSPQFNQMVLEFLEK